MPIPKRDCCRVFNIDYLFISSFKLFKIYDFTAMNLPKVSCFHRFQNMLMAHARVTGQQEWKNLMQFVRKKQTHLNIESNHIPFCTSSVVTKGSEYCKKFTRKIQTNAKPNIDSRYIQGNIIDGKAVAKEIKEELKAEINVIANSHPKTRKPHLSVVLIGNDPASIIYVRHKYRAANETGMTCDVLRLPETVTEEEVREEINVLNKDTTVDGVIVQLPVPEHMRKRVICDSVLPEKDVDGFNVLNVGRFCVDERAFIPATPSGVLEIIKRLKIETNGKNAVVCGRSKNVGLPIALHLQASRSGDRSAGNATTTICHRYTPADQLKQHVLAADIIIAAVGRPGLITSDMVKDGAVVIDIGITRIKDEKGKNRLVGDVDFQGVKTKASLITPVPGGVGPVTVAMVLKNTFTAYKREINFYSFD